MTDFFATLDLLRAPTPQKLLRNAENAIRQENRVDACENGWRAGCEALETVGLHLGIDLPVSDVKDEYMRNGHCPVPSEYSVIKLVDALGESMNAPKQKNELQAKWSAVVRL